MKKSIFTFLLGLLMLAIGNVGTCKTFEKDFSKKEVVTCSVEKVFVKATVVSPADYVIFASMRESVTKASGKLIKNIEIESITSAGTIDLIDDASRVKWSIPNRHNVHYSSFNRNQLNDSTSAGYRGPSIKTRLITHQRLC